ncbi:MAG: pilus assembly protein [Gammaproteobacteria bacterium]
MHKITLKIAPALLFLVVVVGFAAAASAATTAPVPLTVSQTPSIYAQKGIAPNLFLLLDDSGSMQFEYLGSSAANVDDSYPIDNLDYGYPTGSSQPYDGNTYCSGASSGSSCGSSNLQSIPGFDAGNAYAEQYRAAYINPNYYNPAITYTPWACADSYPESESETADVASPISGFDCHWDSTVGLWVMNNADPAAAYLNPVRTGEGFRDIEVWNDSSDDSNQAVGNGFAGNDDGTLWYLHYDDPDAYQCFPHSGDYYHCEGTIGFWPATYFNYFGSMPGVDSDYEGTGNYQRIQICPATATTNSPNGVSSADKCSPPDPLPASPLPYHTYVDGSGNYVYVKSDGTQVSRSPAEELQNFANWYQYYRSHILLADAGIGIAFMQLPTGFRVDYSTINTVDSDGGGINVSKDGSGSPEDFQSADRLTFLQTLYGQAIPPQGTPNRQALQSVGGWFSGTPGSSAPWGNSTDEQTLSGSTPLACRANYVILATDGQWSGSSPGVGNVDNETGPSIPGTAGNAAYQYTPSNPYQDDYSDTLADVAMDYWNTDIQSGLDNDVPTNANDAAYWQHMVTFTVGLGVTPTLVESYMADHPDATDTGAQEAVFQELIDGTASWPKASSNQIDDTWHAAVNGHGTFASASDPTSLYTAISDALVNIINRVGAASSLSVNTEKAGQTRTQVQVFQALFHPQNWWGDVLALPLVTTQAPGSSTTVVSLSSAANWSASCVLTGGACTQMGTTASGQAINTITAQSPSNRTILSWNGSVAVAFEATGGSTLSAAQLSTLGPAAANVVSYVRGDRTNEQGEGGSLRTRTSVMGDVVRSSPVFVGAPGANYPSTWVNLLNTSASPPENESSAQKYSAFVSAEQSRKNVVYAGGNDGILHVFYAPSSGTAADAGRELMGYVPAAVIPNLLDYSNSTYAHHYFLNETPGVSDLFYGNAWHTWLVGGEGAGGDSIFALDITDPANFSESNPGATVKGEWGPDNIACSNVTNCGSDLGDTFGTPVITRFNNGKWGFVFGNGFNSATGVASIFVGLIGSTGGVTFYELKTGYDPSDDPESKSRPDGIAFVTAVDLNNDNSTDYVYAGDYFGNVWRFNLTSSSPANWGVGYAGGSGPMFVATNDAGTDQPITTKLLVVSVPGASGYPRVLVEFGTGADVTDLQQAPDTLASGVQSLYGVWDWDFSQWNKGTPGTGVNAQTPIAFQYAYVNRNTGVLTPLGRANLGQQSITDEVSTNTVQGGTNNNRVVGQSPVCWVDASTASCATNDKYGWYMDLVSSTEGNQGEKVVYNPVLRSGVFLVNTTIPTTASGLTCEAAAINGWTMALDPENGGRLPFEVFDTKGNQKFEEVTVGGKTVPSSGITLGAVGSPGFVTYGGQTYLVINTGSGEAKVALTNLGTGNLAVQLSWQELR